MKILIVDDDEIDRRNLVRLLSRNQSFDITALEETKSLFEQPPATLFDAVILDYHMPDMDGLEVFSKLKSYDSFRESSVLFVSNNEDDSVAEKCIENGAHDFMLKSDLNASRIKRAILLARKRRELEYAVQSSFHKIKYLAEHDTLTSLYNRNTFEKHMERACLQAAFLPFYLVVIDLDGFSSFNDMYGSKVGDLVIMETASRIKQFFGTEQLVARTGNDEFAVIVHQKVFRDDIKSQLLKLSGCLSGQINSSKINTQCTFSIGVSSLVSEFRAEEQVLKEARLSVETGRKKRHASIVYFDKALVEKQNKQQLIQLGIDHHLSENEFNLVFQPIFCKEGALKGVETLIRWPEHSDFGQYSPAEFIPEAESNHQIVELGSWIAKHAIQSLAQIHQNSHLNLFLTINISAVQLDTKTLGEELLSYCNEFGVSSSDIILEITESALMKEHTDTAKQLSRLVDMGFRIALDDFGTGYSSISHLLDFPIAILKTDRSVLPGSDKDEKHKAVMSGLLQIALSLSVTTVIEGIENSWQQQYCLSIGADKLQGYLFSKPITIDELHEFIKTV